MLLCRALLHVLSLFDFRDWFLYSSALQDSGYGMLYYFTDDKIETWEG